MHDSTLINASIILVAGAYAYAALAGLRLHRRSRAASLLWFGGSMTGLAVAYVLFVVQEFSLEHVNRGISWTVAFLGLTVGFWFLLRLACELNGSVAARRVRVIGDVLGVTSVVLQLVVPGRVAIGYVDPTGPQALVHASISLLSIFAVVAGAILLWLGGRGQPGVVRSRFRMLAVAIPFLYLAQLASGVREYPGVILVALLQLFAIGLVVVAAVPPRWMRNAWQAPLLRDVLRELAEVSALTDAVTIRTQLLPTIAHVASARRATMRDVYTGELLGEFGDPEPVAEAPTRRVRVPASSMELEVFGTPHDPFFGNEDEELVRTLGVHLAVALGRSRIIELERDAAAAVTSANAALRRANVDLRDLAELRDSFVAIASHELRTPITTIMGFTSTLLERWESFDDAERLRYLELVDRDASRLGSLVEDLLLLSSVESPDFRIAHEPFDVAGLLVLVADDTGLGEQLGTHVLDGPLVAMADPRHVRQVLSNLVGNARIHGAAPIAIHAAGAASNRVRIEVRDSGSGVDPEFADQMFERFTRGTAAHRSPGSGLGLFIVRRLVELQGGSVWYEDGPDGGACFVVELDGAPAS